MGIPKESTARTVGIREPLTEPVKEEARAELAPPLSEAFFGALLRRLGLDPDGPLPGWWQGWPAREHVRRWLIDFGFSEGRVLEIAEASRRTHPEPPDGPRALDRAMKRAFQQPAQTATTEARPASRKVKEPRADLTPKPAFEDVVALYADWVNRDGYLPAHLIGTSLRAAMLARGLVTEDRLLERGVR